MAIVTVSFPQRYSGNDNSFLQRFSEYEENFFLDALFLFFCLWFR